MSHSKEPEQLTRQMTAAEVDAIFISLRRVKAECRRMGLNKHETAMVLIAECIDKGFNTGKRITGALQTLGFNRQHAGKVLSDQTGDDPHCHGWWREADGVYVRHAPVAT